MTQYYMFAAFIGLMVFALLFWYKRTPRTRLPRREAEELAEKEAKLFKLYQSLEDMMDSFESYVEQQTEQLGKKTEAMAAAEKRVDELADRIEFALRGSEGRWETAESMLGKAELLAGELTERMNRNKQEMEKQLERQQELRQELQKEQEQLQQKQPVPAATDTDFTPMVQPVKQRVLEPIVARPAAADDVVVAMDRQEPVAEIPFSPMVSQNNEVQAQLIKKLVEAKKTRQAKAESQAEQPHFDATVPEFDITTDMAAAVGGEQYPTYTRPAPIKPAAKANTEPVGFTESNEEHSRKQQVLDLYKEGMSAEEISRQLGVAKGAISFILDLQGKLQ